MHDPGMEARVERLERDMTDIKATLGRLEPMIVSIHAQMPFLATKAEVEAVPGELGGRIDGVRGELARKPGYGAMWSMGIALFVLPAPSMSAGAIHLPLLYRAWHITP
jgi:hypothetical protein